MAWKTLPYGRCFDSDERLMCDQCGWCCWPGPHMRWHVCGQDRPLQGYSTLALLTAADRGTRSTAFFYERRRELRIRYPFFVGTCLLTLLGYK